ncbi:MAG TPA: zf-HC2 domain-containing protein [Burkholderiales bacterium]|nr:zf-HC2 domain-containing protein [Burkholderiales bacterium]
MKCDKASRWVEALADDEVRGGRRILLQRHLANCPGCTARLDEARALRQRIRTEIPRFAAPARLRERLERLARSDPERVTPPAPAWPWRWAAGGAMAGAAVTMLGFVVFSGLSGLRTENDVAHALVDEHARAVIARQTVVVASSDQHTVKPWLSSHLDYSPPVHDFADAGFSLVGARIVRIQGHSVAVLAYRYRLHAVDVYVEPSGERAYPTAPEIIRGFNVQPLRAHGMEWTIVSDASPDVLAGLAKRIVDAGY